MTNCRDDYVIAFTAGATSQGLGCYWKSEFKRFSKLNCYSPFYRSR